MSNTLRTTLAALVICLAAAPAHADLIAVYLQGNGGVTSGRVNQAAEGTSPNHGPALGVQLGARLLFAETYFDYATFSGGGSTTRYVAGVRGGAGLGGINAFVRAGLGYLIERDGALAGGLEPMRDRDGLIARAGGGIEKSLGYALHFGGALEAEYFRVSSDSVSLVGDEARSGTDMFLYLYLKLQLGL